MKLKIGLFLVALLIAVPFLDILNHPPILSAPPTNVKDVLSTSQLSYFGRLGTGISAGDSIIRVALSGTAPSLTSNNLFVGDTVAIGSSGTNGALATYTVKDIGNTATIQLSSGLGESNAYTGAAIIATRSAIHTISFTPQSNSTGGFWQFLIKASSRSGENQQDGIPDQQGFDLGQDIGSTTTGIGTRLKAEDVTCPNFGLGSTSAYSVGTTMIMGSNYYHVITCSLGAGASNAVGVGYSLAIGRDLSTGSQLINPSPKDGARTEGTADVYTFYIRHLDNAETLIDSDTMQGKIAVIESVRVTATIDPTLTFTIDNTNVGTGATPCGLGALPANAANTTATAVAYGSISLGTFNDLAQRLSCVTNANSGYVVTVYELGQMHNIADGVTIPDTICDGGCSPTVAAAWTANNTSSQWGYTLENLSVGQTIFSYLTGYKAFGNGSNNAQEIMRNNSTPTTTERAYVCYRLTASTVQEAGNYENRLVYTATATF
jgi:hypothetical protein